MHPTANLAGPSPLAAALYGFFATSLRQIGADDSIARRAAEERLLGYIDLVDLARLHLLAADTENPLGAMPESERKAHRRIGDALWALYAPDGADRRQRPHDAAVSAFKWTFPGHINPL